MSTTAWSKRGFICQGLQRGRTSWILPPLLLLFLALPPVVQAQFTYTTNNGAITITSYSGSGRDVVIPDWINGLPVMCIGSNVFYQRIDLTSVRFGTNVNNIGNWSFHYCYSLTNVTFPSSLTNIGDWAFDNCYGLASITIPGSVKRIGNAAFSVCIGLTNATISNGVGSLGARVFDSCYKLGGITLPNSLGSIGDLAFANCYVLTNCTIPGSVTNIGYGSFTKCTSLTAITVEAANPAYTTAAGVLFNQDQTRIVQYPSGKTGSYTIGDSVTNIEPWAFANAENLTGVTIGSGVTNIGTYAFANCSSLGAITVDSLNARYSSVAGVVFNNDQTSLVQYPPGKAGNYMIPNDVSSIETNAFYSCTGLTGVTIPNRVTNIAGAAFEGCASLTNLTIPNSVATIGDYAFAECTGLTGVTLSTNVTSIGARVFAYCSSLAQIIIPDNVRTIGPSAFTSCSSLTNVMIGKGLTSLGNFAFWDCVVLKSVFFKGNAPSLGMYVFNNDYSATVYYLPDTSGWGAWFADRPSLLWNPVVQRGGPGFGVRTNRFGFNIIGTANIPIVVEACTDLAGGMWVPLQTCTLTNSLVYFSDPQLTNYPARVYRLRSP